MAMIVLPQDQIDKMVEVMDTLLKYPSLTVGDIKRQFMLSSEEYEMIMDLTMPLIREVNVKNYWAVKYRHVTGKIKTLLNTKSLSNRRFRNGVRELIESQSDGEQAMLEAVGIAGEGENQNNN